MTGVGMWRLIAIVFAIVMVVGCGDAASDSSPSEAEQYCTQERVKEGVQVSDKCPCTDESVCWRSCDQYYDEVNGAVCRTPCPDGQCSSESYKCVEVTGDPDVCLPGDAPDTL